jgi:hypothetical protein
MVLAEAVIAAITTIAVSLGFKKIQAETDKNGVTNIFGIDGDGQTVKVVSIKNPALKSPQYDLVNLTTSATEKPATANYFIENNASGNKKVFTIGLIPTDATTKAEAVIEIFLNGTRLFPITQPAQAMLSGVTSLNVPIPPSFGLEIRENEKLEVFMWNPSGNAISLTFAVFIAVQI